MPGHAVRFARRSLFVLMWFPAVALAQAAGPPTAQPDLLAAAKWHYSTDGGKTFSPTWPGPVADKTAMLARAEFQAGDTSGWAGLELNHEMGGDSEVVFALNGARLQGPEELEGVFLRTFPAIDPHLLIAGTNVLTMQWQHRKPKGFLVVQAAPRVSLSVLQASDLEITTGPVLGARGDDYVTVSCRTNLPAKVTVRVNGGFRDENAPPEAREPGLVWHEVTTVSPPGLFHQVHIGELAGLASATYRLQVETLDGAGHVESGPWSLAPLPAAQEPLRFVALGDSRSNPDRWATVATAALKARPQFLIHTGDLVKHGREDWGWNVELVDPAATLLATVPTFVAIGNHEENSPVTALLFAAPPDGALVRWQQTIGPVHLIGIDGQGDWSDGSENVTWLEGVLAASKSKFLFLVTHYPAWTSGKYGKLDDAGEPKDRTTRQSQQVLMPLLARYQATAMIAGHEHFYERSEPPGGVTVITTGGAGAPLRKATRNARAQNPYSQLVVSTRHYCLFIVSGDTCTMEVFTPKGRQLDTRSWTARPGTSEGETLTTPPSDQ